MAIRYKNNWQTTLVAPMGSAWPVLEIAPDMLATLNDVVVGERYLVTLTDGVQHEIIAVSRAEPDGDLIIARGAENTVARDWPASATVFSGVTAGTLTDLRERSHIGRSASSGSVDILDTDSLVALELTQDTLVTLPVMPIGAQLKIIIAQDQQGFHAIDWQGKVDWEHSKSNHGSNPSQVSIAQLYSAGGGKWVGCVTIYGAGGFWGTPDLYAVAWANQSGGVLIALVNGNEEIVHIQIAPSAGYSTQGDPGVKLTLSQDCSKLVFSDYYNEPAVYLYDLKSWDFVMLDMPAYGERLYHRSNAVVVGDWVYGFNGVDGLLRADAKTGKCERLDILAGEDPQCLTGTDTELTLTLIAEDKGAAFTSAIFTYDAETLQLTDTQFELPDGMIVSHELPESPTWLAGKYTFDGSLFALTAAAEYSETGFSTGLHIYDAKTRQLLESHVVQNNITYVGYEPRWSPNNRYCALATGNKTVFVLDRQTGLTIDIDLAPHDASTPDYQDLIVTNDGRLVVTTSTRGNDQLILTLSIETGDIINGDAGWAWPLYSTTEAGYSNCLALTSN